MLQYKIPFITEVVEQEERRMSDLSDWASSVTSTAEIQVMEDSEAVITFCRSFTDNIVCRIRYPLKTELGKSFLFGAANGK